MNILTLDFETYYAKDYGLKKLTTEEYIRDPRFEAIGVAVKVCPSDDSSQVSAPLWFSGSKKQIAEFLARFDWDNCIAVAHNAIFDMAILNWHFDIRPKRIADTLAMARAVHSIEVGGSLAALSEYYKLGVKGTEVHDALGKKRLDFTPEELSAYGGYCVQDVELTYKLFNVLRQKIPNFELALIDLTTRMFTEPVLELDKGVLEAHLKQVLDTKAELMSKVEHEKTKLTSNPQFAELLRQYGVEPPMKISPTTGKETYAFAKSDEAFKELQEHENPTVQALVAARLGVRSTIEETRTQRFIDIANRGTLPIPLRYYAAHTGRWGGCLVADTGVTVYNERNGIETKRIVDVLLSDLVWDGEEFVPHEGVQFSGYDEVIEWDGVTGTADHKVFTEAGEVSLSEAMQGAHRIEVARSPNQDDVDAAREYLRNYKSKDTV